MSKQAFTARLTGLVNKERIELEGGGSIDPATGKTSGRYRLLEIPKGLDPLLLSSCLITGYPNVCASHAELENPFGMLPYRYTRQIVFRNGGKLSLQTNCYYEEGKLRSSFELTGQAWVPKLGAVDPIVESWAPGPCSEGAVNISGNFIVAWHTQKGRLNEGLHCVAEVKTEYWINGKTSPIDQLLHRRIILKAQNENSSLVLDQESTLFS